MRALGIGDNVCDKYITTGMMYPGGQAMNYAVFSKMLGCESAYIGVFGNDRVGLYNKKILSELGIDYQRAVTVEGENGYALVKHEEGERIFIGSNKGGVAGYNPIVLNGSDKEYISTFDVVHTSNNSYCDDLLEIIKETGVFLSYDFSKTWKDKIRCSKISKWADAVFLSGDSDDISGTEIVLEELLKGNVRYAVATFGSKGSVLKSRDYSISLSVCPVKPVDTMGAGDSFAAAILYGIKSMNPECSTIVPKDDMLRIMRNASEFAASTCLRQGSFGFGTEI